MVVRILESIHGHLGVLAMVALLHPTLLLWRGRPLSRGARWSVGLSTALTLAVTGFGIWIYGAYRRDLKPTLVREHFDAAMLFETKEHLAFVVLALALGAGIAAFMAPREAQDARRLAARVYAVATALALVTAALGTYVASIQGF